MCILLSLSLKVCCSLTYTIISSYLSFLYLRFSYYYRRWIGIGDTASKVKLEIIFRVFFLPIFITHQLHLKVILWLYEVLTCIFFFLSWIVKSIERILIVIGLFAVNLSYNLWGIFFLSEILWAKKSQTFSIDSSSGLFIVNTFQQRCHFLKVTHLMINLIFLILD